MSDRLCKLVEDEIEKIADKGLTTSNIDNAYKLTKMKYYLKTTDAMDEYGESFDGYSEARRGRRSMNNSYGNDNSYGMGNDSYSRYSQAKYDYRHSRSNGDHRAIISNLDDYMEEVTDRLNNMMRDADTQEERDVIKRYVTKIKAN